MILSPNYASPQAHRPPPPRPRSAPPPPHHLAPLLAGGRCPRMPSSRAPLLLPLPAVLGERAARRTMIARVMHSILDDPRLAPYRLVADPPALEQAGLFAVEGRLALPYLLASRYRVHSVLVSEAAFAALEAVLTPRKDVH